MQKKAKIIKSIIFSKIKRRPYKLNFAITSACNSRCKTCNVWQKFQKNPKTVKSDLKLSEIEKVFKSLPKNFTWLSLSGGEPFLRKDLVRICQKAVENISSLCLISIPSNGLLTSKTIRNVKQILKLPLPNLFLNFSIDGPEKIHDHIRGIPGAFKKTWFTYKKLLALSRKEPRLTVNIETTISKYNLNHLENFFKKLTADGHKITITLAHTGYLYKNIKDNKEFTKLNHNEKKLEKIIKIVKQTLFPASPIDLIEKIYLDQILKFHKNPRKQSLPCIALEASLALDAKGNITPCFMWEKILGNIRNFDCNLKKLMESEQKEILETKELIKAQKCPNCWTPCEAYQSIINSFLSRQGLRLIKSI